MPDLKLAKLPERTPIKLTISVLPELHHLLENYARIYQQVHGNAEPIVDLIPAMLAAFIDADRGFAKAQKSLGDLRSR